MYDCSKFILKVWTVSGAFLIPYLTKSCCVVNCANRASEKCELHCSDFTVTTRPINTTQTQKTYGMHAHLSRLTQNKDEET